MSEDLKSKGPHIARHRGLRVTHLVGLRAHVTVGGLDLQEVLNSGVR